MSPAHTTDQTLELFVRSLAARETHPKQAELLDEVAQLTEAGIIADYTVHIVGREVCPATAMKTDTGQFLCGRVRQFQEWARRNGLCLDTVLQQRSVHSEMTGETYEVLEFPTLVIAAFDGASLQAVAPCLDGDRRYTVEDLLASLSTGRPPTTPQSGSRASQKRSREGDASSGDVGAEPRRASPDPDNGPGELNVP